MLGLTEGLTLGETLGLTEGETLGEILALGLMLGLTDGLRLMLGETDGLIDGLILGDKEGEMLGDNDTDGLTDGETDGDVKLDYPLTKAGEDKMNNFADAFKNYLLSQKTIKNGEIVPDDFQIEERIDGLKSRIFLKQLTNLYFYRVYSEILSDHMPAYMTCKLN